MSGSLLPRPRVAFVPSAPYARAVRWLEGQGHPRSAILRGTHIELPQLERPDGVLNLDQVEALVLNAVEAVANPTGGLAFGSGLVLPSHGIVGYAGLTAPNVDGALRVAEDFLELVTPLFVLESEEDASGKTVRFVPRYRMSDVVYAVHVKVVVGSLSVAIKHGVGQVPATIGVQVPADQSELFEWLSAFGLRVDRGGSVLAIRFPRVVLELPFVLADAQAHANARERCRTALAARAPHERTIREVRRLLREGGRPFQDLETISRRVGVSSRTLRRRLAAEGSSFRELLEQARLSLALRLLSRSDRDITSIAYELGYSNPANFSRAFGRRLGLTPSEYRSRHGAGRAPCRPPRGD